MASDEFDIIRRYFNAGTLAFPSAEVALGIGDDCALLRPQSGMELAMSMDLLQESVHFPSAADPFLLGKRSLLVNLSDLAAMGARPLCFTLGLCLPRVDADWLEGFSRGLAEVARANGCPLVGGDMSGTQAGATTICIQVQGEVPAGQALRRDGAKPGDLVFVTGTLGDAAAGLGVLQGRLGESLSAARREALLEAFYVPESRIGAGLRLRGLASACIDLSDGLASDLLHVLNASGVGAQIDLQALPLSSALQAAVPTHEQQDLAVSGGDDYELCFTAPSARQQAVQEALTDAGIPVSCIGRITAQKGLVWQQSGSPVSRQWQGYRHFVAAEGER